MTGGRGRSGGAGGRLAAIYEVSHFAGSYVSAGGEGHVRETGAAGTVFLKHQTTNIPKTLRVYNRKNGGVRHFFKKSK